MRADPDRKAFQPRAWPVDGECAVHNILVILTTISLHSLHGGSTVWIVRTRYCHSQYVTSGPIRRIGNNMSASRLKLISSILALLGITALSTVGLMQLEGWSAFDAFWLTIISLSTTGYGDIVPQTTAGRVFLLGVLVSGLVIVTYTLGTVINILVEGQFARFMENDRVTKAIEKLEKHIIVCGAGRVGSSVAMILKAEKAPYVVIEKDEELARQMCEEGHLVLQGDATQDEVLHAAGLKRAMGIICALSEDAYNVFVVLTARAVNPSLRIVSRAVHPETTAKLRHAGADKIISPNHIGGHRMAMAILKPTAIELIDTLFAPHNLEIQLEEVRVTDKSPTAHRQIQDVFDRRIANVIVVAIIRKGNAIMNPSSEETLLPDDVLVLIGSSVELEKLKF